MWNLAAGFLSSAIAVAVCLGCTVHHVPSAFPVESDRIPPFFVAADVRVLSAQPPSTKRTISIPGGADASVDLREFSALAVRQLQDELQRLGARIVTENPAKSLELAIADARIMPLFGRSQCLIDFVVVMADGKRRGLQARASSWDYRKAMDAAISMMVVETLTNEEVRRYLAESS